MNKRILGFATVLLLAGAGCSQSNNTALMEQQKTIKELTTRLASTTEKIDKLQKEKSSEEEQSIEPSGNQTIEITRKAELELEGFINDYFYRRQTKDSSLFLDFNAYGSVLAKSIVVYVYPKNDLPQGRAEDIRGMIEKDLQEQLLDFPGFEWTKSYSFSVVIR